MRRRGRPAVVLAPIAPRTSRLPSLAAFRARLRVRGRALSAEVAADRGRHTLEPLRGSLKHLKRSTDELMALTRGDD